MWASFPEVLNLIFVVFNFANGHRLTKLNPPQNIRRIRYTDGVNVPPVLPQVLPYPPPHLCYWEEYVVYLCCC